MELFFITNWTFNSCTPCRRN